MFKYHNPLLLYFLFHPSAYSSEHRIVLSHLP
uniref:Uncharacterized protein n=1 Tax=Arundo donax TaxID=35708 RepID=A0A0A9A2W4_ARUDO